jgi:hypothetical protein
MALLRRELYLYFTLNNPNNKFNGTNTSVLFDNMPTYNVTTGNSIVNNYG